LQIDGLGGSYGVERLTFYRMGPQMGPPETTIWEYPGEDMSWSEEFRHFRDCIATGRTPSGNLEDAIAALDVVEEVYRQSTIHSVGQTYQSDVRIVGQAGEPDLQEWELRKAI